MKRLVFFYISTICFHFGWAVIIPEGDRANQAVISQLVGAANAKPEAKLAIAGRYRKTVRSMLKQGYKPSLTDEGEILLTKKGSPVGMKLSYCDGEIYQGELIKFLITA